ncbi:MAG TPA: hypothetical protein VF579_03865 [Candidatus Methylomirabilis sp.]
MRDAIFASPLAGASAGRGGVSDARVDAGRGRTRGGHGRRATPLARCGSGALSLADLMEPPPVVVTERKDG